MFKNDVNAVCINNKKIQLSRSVFHPRKVNIESFYSITHSVSIMFDIQRSVKVLFDENFKGKKVMIYPLRNTASVSITFDDSKRFVEYYGFLC